VNTAGIPGLPHVGVLAVQGSFAEHQELLAAVGAQTTQVRTTADLQDLDGLVLPGGESSTIGLVAGESGLLDAIRVALAAGLPAFGTCAGMIMLSSATAGGAQPLIGGIDITVRRNAYGRQQASFETPLHISGIEGAFEGVFIRAPWVEESSPNVQALATYDGRPVLVRQGSLLAAAFHPEFTDDARLHGLFLDIVRERREAVLTQTGGNRVRA
jgi:pyridoxal 5'-phosphate synthase pdxT subunit